MTNRDVTRTSEQLADAIAEHVRGAVALERDRVDSELAELRNAVTEIAAALTRTAEIIGQDFYGIPAEGQSVRVDP